MHVRFSMAEGMPVVEDRSDSVVARVSGVLCDPDRGVVVGFFVESLSDLRPALLFLSAHDIVAWGAYIHILDADRLVEPTDLIRLQPLLESGCTLLGQTIATQRRGTRLGRCRDIQFDTHHFRIEWLFPYMFFIFAKKPIASSEIVEVTRKRIIVKEPLKPLPIEEEDVEAYRAKINDVVSAASMKNATNYK